MESNPCIFVSYCSERIDVIIAVYVDDLIIAYSSDQTLKRVINMLENDFEMKDLGVPKEMLG
jgi:Reverse transcriptase (RNA-dependent DNA polymerase)